MHRSFAVDPRNVTANPRAQIHSCGKETLPSCGRVQVQMVASRTAPKTLIDISHQVGRETAAFHGSGAMHWTRATNFCAFVFVGDEPQKIQNLSHAHARTNFLEADAWHGCFHAKQRRQRRGTRRVSADMASFASRIANIELPAGNAAEYSCYGARRGDLVTFLVWLFQEHSSVFSIFLASF